MYTVCGEEFCFLEERALSKNVCNTGAKPNKLYRSCCVSRLSVCICVCMYTPCLHLHWHLCMGMMLPYGIDLNCPLEF